MPTEEQRLSFQTKPAEGQRFDYHLFPTAQRGGMSFYPVSGVVQGCRVSSPNLVEKDSNVVGDPPSSYVSFQLSDGEIKLDGVPIQVADFSSGMEAVVPLPSAFDDLSQGESGDTEYKLVVPIFINPRRMVPVYETGNLPPASEFDEGAKLAEVSPHAEFDEYLVVRNFFRKVNSTWEVYNRDIVFESPVEGQDWGQNNLPFNAIKEKDITPTDADVVSNNDASTSFSSSNQGIISRLPEKKVYNKSVRPIYVAGPAHAYLRESASLYLADLEYTISIVAGSFDSFSVEVNHRRARTRMAI